MMYVKLAYEGQGGRWFGDLVAKSCSTPVTPWTVARQGPLSMKFSRISQEYWSGLPFFPPQDLPNPGIKPRSPALQADSLLSEPPGKPNLICTSLILNDAEHFAICLKIMCVFL